MATKKQFATTKHKNAVLFGALKESASQPQRKRIVIKKIVANNYDLIRSVAYRFRGNCPEDFEDLMQLGAIGLLKAIDRFDSERGQAFSSFAVPYIKGEIQHFLRDHWGAHPKIPRRYVETHSKVKKIAKALEKKGHWLPLEIIAECLGIGKEKWQEIESAISRKPLASVEDCYFLCVEKESETVEDLIKIAARLSALEWAFFMDSFVRSVSVDRVAKTVGITSKEGSALVDRIKEKISYAISFD